MITACDCVCECPFVWKMTHERLDGRRPNLVGTLIEVIKFWCCPESRFTFPLSLTTKREHSQLRRAGLSRTQFTTISLSTVLAGAWRGLQWLKILD